MKAAKWCAVVAAVMIGFSISAQAEQSAADKPDKADKPKAEKSTPKPKTYRLISPFSKLQSLTADQEEQLKAIHGRYLEQIKVLQQQEKEEMMAVLTDAQKTELEQIEEQAKAARKAQAAQKREQEKKEAIDAQSDAE